MNQTLPLDYQLQQQAIDRKRALAQALQAQSIAPTEGQIVSGHYVAPSWTQYAAKLAQGLIGKDQEDRLDQQQYTLAEIQRKQQMNLLKGLAPKGVFDEDVPNAMPGQLGSGMYGDVQPYPGLPQVPEQNQYAQIDPSVKDAWNRAANAYQLNPELGNSLIKNLSELTNEQKNNAAMGIDPKIMGRALLAKSIKEGRMEAQPGNTIIDPITLKPLFTAPDFKTGIQGGFDAQGRPIMGAIQGSEVIPQMAGMTKRAEAAANADYTPTTVNTPGRPTMTTVGNVVRSVNGQQAPNMGFPANVSVPNVNSNQNDRMAIFNQERNQILARPDSDPRKAGDLAAIDREIARIGGNTSNPTVNGIPLESESEKQYKIDTAKNLAERENVQPQATFAVKSAIGNLDGAIKQVDSLLNHKGLNSIVGPIAGRTPNLRGDSTNAQSILDSLKSQISTQVLSSMREASKTGGAVGNVTEKEWPRLEAQLGALSQAQTFDQFKENLNDVKSTMGRIRSTYVEEYETKYGKREDLKRKPPLGSFNTANRPSLDSFMQR